MWTFRRNCFQLLSRQQASAAAAATVTTTALPSSPPRSTLSSDTCLCCSASVAPQLVSTLRCASSPHANKKKSQNSKKRSSSSASTTSKNNTNSNNKKKNTDSSRPKSAEKPRGVLKAKAVSQPKAKSSASKAKKTKSAAAEKKVGRARDEAPTDSSPIEQPELKSEKKMKTQQQQQQQQHVDPSPRETHSGVSPPATATDTEISSSQFEADQLDNVLQKEITEPPSSSEAQESATTVTPGSLASFDTSAKDLLGEWDTGVTSSSTATSTITTEPSMREAIARIHWEDTRTKLQNFIVTMASATNAHQASATMSAARAYIRTLENSFFFVNDSRVCLADHDTPLTFSVAVEFINAAIRFGVPASALFVSAFFKFLAESASRDTTDGFLRGTDSAKYLVMIVNGCRHLSALRVWDEAFFQFHQENLKESLRHATLRDLVAMINAIGAKEVGAAVARSKQELVGGLAGDGSQQQTTASGAASSSLVGMMTMSPSSAAAAAKWPSSILPVFFGSLVQRLDALVQETTSIIDNSSDSSSSNNNDTNNDSNTNNNHHQFQSIADAVVSFSDSSIALDPLMRDHILRWVCALIERAPPDCLQPLILASSTLRLEGVFYPALERSLILSEQLGRITLSKLLPSVTYLPRKAFAEFTVKTPLRNGDENNNINRTKFKTTTIYLQPDFDEKVTPAMVAAVARKHFLWEVPGVSSSSAASSLAHLKEASAFEIFTEESFQSHSIPSGENQQQQHQGSIDPNKTLMQQNIHPGATLVMVPISGESTVDEQHNQKNVVKLASEAQQDSDAQCDSHRALAVDTLLFRIVELLVSSGKQEHETPNDDDDAATTAERWPEIAANLTTFLGGAVAVQLNNHAAVTWAADVFHEKIVSRAFPTELTQLTAEMEFLSLSSSFRSQADTSALLENVLTQMKEKSTLFLETRKVDPLPRIRSLTATQLRLFCCAALAVNHELDKDIAHFLLLQLVEIINDATLPDISAVLYSVGRAGVSVKEAHHVVIGRRISSILRIARASKRFSMATVGGGRSSSSISNMSMRSSAAGSGIGLLSGGGGGGTTSSFSSPASSTGSSSSLSSATSPREQNDVAAHELAVILSGLHLTKFRWDSQANLFSDMVSAIESRRKRYTPAQCCQLVAIARDVARTAQHRGNGVLAAEATKLARVFLPQIRLSIPSATHADLLPLLAWLSTGHIRDVTLLNSMLDRLLCVKAPAGVCTSVLDNIYSMGLLGGISSDAVFRLISMIQCQATADQCAQLAFYTTQLRSRDAELIKQLVTNSRNAKSVKALCSVIGAVSVLGSISSAAEKYGEEFENDLKRFTRRLEVALDRLLEQEQDNEKTQALVQHRNRIAQQQQRQQQQNRKHETQQQQEQQQLELQQHESPETCPKLEKNEDEVVSEVLDETLENGFVPEPSRAADAAMRAEEAEGNKNKSNNSNAAAVNEVGSSESSSTGVIENKALHELVSKSTPPSFHQQRGAEDATTTAPKGIFAQFQSSSSSSGDATATSSTATTSATHENKNASLLSTTTSSSSSPSSPSSIGLDIDIECIISAMTALASNEDAPIKTRTRFLNRLNLILDLQLSLMPALRAAASSSTSAATLKTMDSQSLQYAMAASTARVVPLGPLSNLLAEIAAQNIPAFAVFRTCGRSFVAPGILQQLTPRDAVRALAAYAVFGFRDDFVIRCLAGRCFSLKTSIVKHPQLAKQCADAMAVFHISFHDPRPPGYSQRGW